MSTSTRIYDDNTDINASDVQSFWQARSKQDDLHSVLLGNPKDMEVNILRNEHETKIFKSHIPNIEHASILDIGCGTGRWVENLSKNFKEYQGFDFTKGYIDQAKEKYIDNNNCHFWNMSITEMNKTTCPLLYDIMIINGVIMYINDAELPDFFKNLSKICAPHAHIYFQESISLLAHRLTLKNFYSEELQTEYNSIYRTKDEYENHFRLLNDFSIVATDLLLNEQTGARQETQAQYWVLKRG